MKPIIRVERLSKQYAIGSKPEPYATLRESLVKAARFPLNVFKGRSKGNGNSSFWALKDVSFEVNPGEVVGIIGRNGAGKSTLLKILSRITEPTRGRIELYGRVGSLLEVGTGFHPELTGRENIFLNGAILGMRREEIAKKFDEIVDFAEIEDFLDTPVKRYSSGMYTRLAFAVAANLEPEILIVDEVLAVGDAEFQKKCLGKMHEVSKQDGRTVLFVSHNMTAVQNLCTKAILLRGGQVANAGNTKDIINEYLSKDTAVQLEQRWDKSEDAPGNDAIRLKRVTVSPVGVEETSVITVETPIEIEFEFWNLLSEPAEINLSLVLWSVAGECIFNVGSSVVELSPGLCQGVCRIPANLLNDNKYSVEIYFIKDTSIGLYKQADVVTFEVQDVRRNINWYGKWIGAVRPKLDFDLSQIQASKNV
jgi:lipopolysaccharide transport system ATP-binding protein